MSYGFIEREIQQEIAERKRKYGPALMAARGIGIALCMFALWHRLGGE